MSCHQNTSIDLSSSHIEFRDKVPIKNPMLSFVQPELLPTNYSSNELTYHSKDEISIFDKEPQDCLFLFNENEDSIRVDHESPLSEKDTLNAVRKDSTQMNNYGEISRIVESFWIKEATTKDQMKSDEFTSRMNEMPTQLTIEKQNIPQSFSEDTNWSMPSAGFYDENRSVTHFSRRDEVAHQNIFPRFQFKTVKNIRNEFNSMLYTNEIIDKNPQVDKAKFYRWLTWQHVINLNSKLKVYNLPCLDPLQVSELTYDDKKKLKLETILNKQQRSKIQVRGSQKEFLNKKYCHYLKDFLKSKELVEKMISLLQPVSDQDLIVKLYKQMKLLVKDQIEAFE